jgi:hypothetical protein
LVAELLDAESRSDHRSALGRWLPSALIVTGRRGLGEHDRRAAVAEDLLVGAVHERSVGALGEGSVAGVGRGAVGHLHLEEPEPWIAKSRDLPVGWVSPGLKLTPFVAVGNEAGWEESEEDCPLAPTMNCPLSTAEIFTVLPRYPGTWLELMFWETASCQRSSADSEAALWYTPMFIGVKSAPCVPITLLTTEQ